MDRDETVEAVGGGRTFHDRHRLDVALRQGDDVGHRIDEDADDTGADGDDDDDMGRAGCGRPLPEASPQVEDWYDGAAQVDHATHERRRVRQRGRDLPGADLANQLDVDAVVLL